MNFDPVARHYDWLARLIFGKSITNAQIIHFKKIKNNAKILIVGGGTGWIMEFLPVNYQSITFIEPSKKMLSIAQSRELSHHIEFINANVEDVPLELEYDVIITNFFFDLFDNTQGNAITRKLLSSLKEEGIWIQTDFERNGIWWQTVMLVIMYLFFNITTGLSTRRLSDWKVFFRSAGMEMIEGISFYREFISTICYKKPCLSV